MSRLGFLGTGAIAAAIVDGLGDGPEIHLSPRNAAIAHDLAARHAGVHVCADNQEVVDRAELLFLTVRPDVAPEVLGQLRIPPDRVLISAVAGLSLDALSALAPGVPVVRTIPLPAVRQRRGITAIYPAHPAVEELFDQLGGALAAPSEAALDVLSAATASVSSYQHYLATVTDWVAGHGVESATAQRYVRGMFQGLDLAGSHETPGGINEQLRTTWFTERNRAALQQSLDAIYQRLT